MGMRRGCWGFRCIVKAPVSLRISPQAGVAIRSFNGYVRLQIATLCSQRQSKAAVNIRIELSCINCVKLIVAFFIMKFVCDYPMVYRL